MEKVSGFMIKALQKEDEILRLLEEKTRGYEQELLAMPEIRTVRIAKNHAQLRSITDALALVVPLGAERLALVHQELCRMAVQRQETINADHKVVREFWDLYEFLDDEGDGLNHSRNKGQIAVNLNEFVKKAVNERQQMPAALSELKRLLKTSKSPKFIEANKPINSGRKEGEFIGKTVRCWIFQP